jgi:hypothetical protein
MRGGGRVARSVSPHPDSARRCKIGVREGRFHAGAFSAADAEAGRFYPPLRHRAHHFAGNPARFCLVEPKICGDGKSKFQRRSLIFIIDGGQLR